MSWTRWPLLARNEIPFFSVAPFDPLPPSLPKEGRRRHGRDGVGARRTIRPPPRPRHLLRPLIHPPELVRGVEDGAGARPARAGGRRPAPEEEARQAQAPQPRSHRQVLPVAGASAEFKSI
ncbi:hypothetical protein ACQJBY_072943 [Aegilops geniculata]